MQKHANNRLIRRFFVLPKFVRKSFGSTEIVANKIFPLNNPVQVSCFNQGDGKIFLRTESDLFIESTPFALTDVRFESCAFNGKDYLLIICVCGNNIKAREEIDAIVTEKKVLNFGYVNNVDELMDAADCILTKPGGITSSEALAKRLPMIICNPIPGQEERNAEFLQNNGAAIAVGGAFSVSDAVSMMFRNPKRVETMREAIELIRKPNSTVDICRTAEELFASGNRKGEN